MGKNVAVFVDVANIFYAAKAAGVDIDYVTLLKSAIAGRDFVRAYAYTGLDPDNENQRNFHNFLARHGYKVVSKDIRKYGDGKVKANLDIELVVDMMKTARNLDVAIVVSGDGDFAPAIRAVQEMGVRVEVISFRGNTSSDLIDVADQFSDIIQLARVEKGSSRSGRRVADDGEDLSMTEVPDKLTEGTGRGRGRGTGRGRGRTGDAEREPVAASAARTTRGGTRTRRAEPELEVVAATGAGVGLVALPGEKLSKAAMARLEAAGPTTPTAVDVEDSATPANRPTSESSRTATSRAADADAAAAVGVVAEGVPRAASSRWPRRARSRRSSTRGRRGPSGRSGRDRGHPPAGSATGRLRIGLGLADRPDPDPVGRVDPVRPRTRRGRTGDPRVPHRRAAARQLGAANRAAVARAGRGGRGGGYRRRRRSRALWPRWRWRWDQSLSGRIGPEWRRRQSRRAGWPT